MRSRSNLTRPRIWRLSILEVTWNLARGDDHVSSASTTELRRWLERHKSGDLHGRRQAPTNGPKSPTAREMSMPLCPTPVGNRTEHSKRVAGRGASERFACLALRCDSVDRGRSGKPAYRCVIASTRDHLLSTADHFAFGNGTYRMSIPIFKDTVHGLDPDTETSLRRGHSTLRIALGAAAAATVPAAVFSGSALVATVCGVLVLVCVAIASVLI